MGDKNPHLSSLSRRKDYGRKKHVFLGYMGTWVSPLKLSFELCSSMSIINQRAITWDAASIWVSQCNRLEKPDQYGSEWSGRETEGEVRSRGNAGMQRGWQWYGNNEVPFFREGVTGIQVGLVGKRGVGWSDGSRGCQLSLTRGWFAGRGTLIDWLSDLGDPAECEWSVYQTAPRREDCTRGMMGNKWLWRGRLRADGDWQLARFVQFLADVCLLGVQGKAKFVRKWGVHQYLNENINFSDQPLTWKLIKILSKWFFFC